MKNDEQAIRELVQMWLSATKTGDMEKVLSLMADDVIFMVPGQAPFGKQAFAASAQEMRMSILMGRATFRNSRSSATGHGCATDLR
jgi:uncharacterized protein (TIGR02246 family)